MRKQLFKVFLFLNGLVLLQNIQFIISKMFEINLIDFLPNLFLQYFFFFNHFIGVALFFWTFFYIKKYTLISILCFLNIILEYVLVFYIIGDSF